MSEGMNGGSGVPACTISACESCETAAKSWFTEIEVALGMFSLQGVS
jgi:hypothetical protein